MAESGGRRAGCWSRCGHRRFGPRHTRRLLQVHSRMANLAMNRTAFLFTLIVSLITGLLFGLVPAFQSTKTNFNEALKEGGKGSSGKASHNRARNAMVVAEVALSLVLLIGAGLMVRSFIELLHSDFGVDPANVLTMEVSLRGEKYDNNEVLVDTYNQILSRIEALPGVTRVGATGILPLAGFDNSHHIESIGQTVFPKGKQPVVKFSPVTAGYLAAIGPGLLTAAIRRAVRSGRASSRVVNETLLRGFCRSRPRWPVVICRGRRADGNRRRDRRCDKR